MNRRNFLQASFGLGALAASGMDVLASVQAKSIGLQLYTLRDDIQKQGIERILEQVAKLGYKKVENFGYTQGKFFGKSPAEYAKILKDNGLSAVSGHYLTARSKKMAMSDGLTKNWSKVIDDAAAIGQKFAVIAYLVDDERSPEDYKKLVDLLHKGSETTKKAGITLGYHNHDFEFTQRVDGVKPYDLLLKQTPVHMEMDLYWVTKAGEKPQEYFAKYPGRFPLWHVKDMAKTPQQEFAEVGTGSIDFGALFKHAKQAGLKHYFVEQDVCKRPPLESIKISIGNIQKSNWG
ncbi:sugar phosphate isomerase/epimerase family protein [Siphonobacter aquaeclarae]|jgi:sugar phosphate isomerase/epimerase|uniref:Sugar phosphate isomerase/epimerase n=1 Tax=Siphonobacter aquaeclarae TaxID=563176 RepID=A0A1G9W9G6_9BACT|nr:sugar phosphate isomerase/epimerase [Siphonobacter aquaeclarae]MBO9638485.1 sugar phosphate isomerase/epimerase [Siphonobacter aquaeclarae]SDM81140.1 Sugar phosphate isomerase/epimerase [Siphonobacter aquaeclarae]